MIRRLVLAYVPNRHGVRYNRTSSDIQLHFPPLGTSWWVSSPHDSLVVPACVVPVTQSTRWIQTPEPSMLEPFQGIFHA